MSTQQPPRAFFTDGPDTAMKCTTCHVERDDSDFVSKTGTRTVRTCFRCRTHKKQQYTTRKQQASAELSPEDLLKELLSRYTAWWSKQPPEQQAQMRQAVGAQ